MSEVQYSVALDPTDPADIEVFLTELNTVKYGFGKPFFWIEMPDGKRNHFITRGKFMASLAVLRMNYPNIKLQPVGTLPAPKRKSK
jgi:hypothetical protein